MRWLLVLIAAALPACAAAPQQSTELRVRDPWQIAVVNVTRTGTSPRLPASEREHGHRCEIRDDEGFPHFCAFGDFLVTDDGALIVSGVPEGDDRTMRLRPSLYRRTNFYRRGHGWTRCTGRPEAIEFVTPWSNVAALHARAGPIRAALELPNGAVGN